MRIIEGKTARLKKCLTSMSGLYLSSNTAIAAKDPEPTVTQAGHLFSQCIQI